MLAQLGTFRAKTFAANTFGRASLVEIGFNVARLLVSAYRLRGFDSERNRFFISARLRDLSSAIRSRLVLSKDTTSVLSEIRKVATRSAAAKEFTSEIRIRNYSSSKSEREAASGIRERLSISAKRERD